MIVSRKTSNCDAPNSTAIPIPFKLTLSHRQYAPAFAATPINARPMLMSYRFHAEIPPSEPNTAKNGALVVYVADSATGVVKLDSIVAPFP